MPDGCPIRPPRELPLLRARLAAVTVGGPRSPRGPSRPDTLPTDCRPFAPTRNVPVSGLEALCLSLSGLDLVELFAAIRARVVAPEVRGLVIDPLAPLGLAAVECDRLIVTAGTLLQYLQAEAATALLLADTPLGG